jgi:hypothetical protein
MSRVGTSKIKLKAGGLTPKVTLASSSIRYKTSPPKRWMRSSSIPSIPWRRRFPTQLQRPGFDLAGSVRSCWRYGRERPSGDVDSRPRRRLRAAGSNLIAAIRRSVARRCASSPTEAPTVRQILVHLGERLSPARFSPARGPPLWRCRMPGRTGSTPKPSRHRITNSISVSRGRCHDKTRPRSPVMGRLVPGAIRPTVCACSRDPKHSSEGDSCHFSGALNTKSAIDRG